METNTEFAKSLKLDYPILSDPDGTVAQKFGIYNAERKLASRVTFIISADGKIVHVDDKVDTGKHGEDVARKLAELGIPKK